MIFLRIKKSFYQDIENYLWGLSCLFSCLSELGRNSHIKIKIVWGFPPQRRTASPHVKIYDKFSRVLDVANQLLTRHSLYSAP